MHVLKSIDDIPFVDRLAIIINCGTRLVTTLALVSAIRSGASPVLVVNCESQDGSFDHFGRLAERFSLQFYWLEWPLKSHGRTLDALFLTTPAREILLVDSDVEVPGTESLEAFSRALSLQENSYGAGLIHGPAQMGLKHGVPPTAGFYAERMWIPLVLLRGEPIRAAILRGESFQAFKEFHEVSWSKTLSRVLGMRFWIPGLRRLRPLAHPAFTQLDTGASLHRSLLQHGFRFAEVGNAESCNVLHFHGVTRALRVGIVRRLMRASGLLRDKENEATQQQTQPIVLARLKEYGIEALD